MKKPFSPLFSQRCDIRIPGEFEAQESVVFGCGQLVRHYPQLFVDFVKMVHERVNLFGVIAPQFERLAKILLATSGIPSDAVTFLTHQTSAMWMRDFSPIGALDRHGGRIFLNFNQEHMRNRDDIGMTDLFEKRFRGNFRKIHLNLEGGNLLSNGGGLLLSSKTILIQNQARGDHSKIAQVLEAEAGGVQWAAVDPLAGERTGHVDLIASFLSPRLLAIGEIDTSDHPENAARLNEISNALDGFQTSVGKIEVVRIPMPSSHDTYFRSYCNVMFANGLLVVPTFPSVNPKLDRYVLDLFSELMPEWTVLGLDCDEIARQGGSLHCMTMNIPPNVSAVSPIELRNRGVANDSGEVLPR